MMFPKGPVTAMEVFSTESFIDKEHGAAVLQLISQNETVRPTKISGDGVERYTVDFSDELVPSIVDHWIGEFLWRRTKPTVNGCVLRPHRRKAIHSGFSIEGRYDRAQATRFCSVTQEAVASFECDLAIVHCFGKSDYARAVCSGTAFPLDREKVQRIVMVSTMDLRRFLPDLWWGTFFGRPYVEMFGRERLLSCPAYRVEEWRGGVWVQLSENPLDATMDPDPVEPVRVRCKEHLGKDAFFDPDISEDYPYRVPDFSHLVAEIDRK